MLLLSLSHLPRSVEFLLCNDTPDGGELFVCEFGILVKLLLFLQLSQLHQGGRDHGGQLLLVRASSILGNLCSLVPVFVAIAVDAVLVPQFINDGRRHRGLQEVGAIGNFVDIDSVGVVVMSFWLWGVLGGGPWDLLAETRDEAGAAAILSCFSIEAGALDNDGVENCILERAGLGVAERMDELDVLKGYGKGLRDDGSWVGVFDTCMFGDKPITLFEGKASSMWAS